MMCHSRRPLDLFNVSLNNSTLRSMKTSFITDDFETLLMEHERLERRKSDTACLEARTTELEKIGAKLLAHISDAGFNAKYGRDFMAPQNVHSYLFVQQPRQFTYVFEAFASVVSFPSDTLKHKKDEIVFHAMFEDLIERYTKTRAKPNPVLLETRNSEFCYRLAIFVEAVPIEVQNSIGFSVSTLRLIREFEILYYVWEKYREEFLAKTCSSDYLVGIPMPFEFFNVTNSEFDFELVKTTIYYFDIRGSYVPVTSTRLPGTGRPLESFLSYMSMEKLGPSLSYLGDMLKLHKRWFSVSTALKILDQILCRLMVLHRYGVILGNMDVKFLNFGVREAINVLYIGNFDCAVVAPTTNKPLVCFNERFASTGVFRNQVHFVNDLETAFYIFLSLLVPRLPWDEKEPAEQRNGSWSVVERNRSIKVHLDERQRLWDNPSSCDRILHSFINTDSSSTAYKCFAFDVIQTVQSRIKDAISTCATIPQQEFMNNAMTVSTVPHNAYIGIRKAIVSFFRFESLSNSLRDAACQNRVDRLVESESSDSRALWDLNDWCWNIFETTFLSGGRPRNSTKSLKLN